MRAFCARPVSSQILRRATVAVVSGVISAALSGCGSGGSGFSLEAYPRLNHYHSDANQKIAEEAADKFEEFTAGTGSLKALLDKDLQARQALEKTVSEARVQVVDNELAKLSTDVNWYKLRAHLFQDLGLLANEGLISNGAITANNPPVDVEDPRLKRERLEALVAQYNTELADKIQARQARVAAVARVLRLLATAQQVLVDQARTDATRAAATVAKDNAEVGAKPATPDPDAESRICFLNALLKQFADIGEEIRQSAAAREKANLLQTKLLAAVENGRDPASIVALAAMVGTGLDDDSFVLLDDYLAHLQEQLDGLKALSKRAHELTAPIDASNQVTDGWKNLIDAMDSLLPSLTSAQDAQRYEAATRLVRITTAPAGVDIGGAELKGAVGLKAARLSQDVSLRLEELASRAPTTASVMRPSAQTYRASMSKEIDKGVTRSVLVQVKQSANLARKGATSETGFDVTGSIARAGVTLADTRRSLAKSSKALRAAAPPALKSTSCVGKSAAFPLKEGVRTKATALATGETFLQTVLSTNPQAVAAINALLGKALSCPSDGARGTVSPVTDKPATAKTKGGETPSDHFAALGSAVQGILASGQKEQQIALARVDQFLSDLAVIELEIGGENMRHSTAVLTVAELEVKRWTLLGVLNDQYGEIFLHNTMGDPNAKLEPPTSDASWIGRLTQSDLLKALDEQQRTLGNAQFESYAKAKEFVAEEHQLFKYEEDLFKAQEAFDTAAARAASGAADAKADLASATINLAKVNDQARNYYSGAADWHKAGRERVAALSAEAKKLQRNADVLKADVLRLQRSVEYLPLFNAAGEAVDAQGNPVKDATFNPLSVRLFRDGAALHKAEFASISRGKVKQPDVEPRDSVLGSLRLLAETAKFFHNAPADAANAVDVAVSNSRLAKAVGAVSGHILMLSSNQHLSEDNVIRANTEISEHELQLDALEARIKESGYRLTLGDIKAFHTSGITDADIKTLETALLGYIAAKQ